MFSKRVFLIALFSVVFAGGPFIFGQATGSFSGTISDNTGAVLSGATVTVTAPATNFSRDFKTDDSGHYLVPLLGVGIYNVHAEAPGFKPGDQKDLRLQVDEQREVNFKLVPATVSTSVEVSATEVAVETSNPTLGQVITAEQVSDLPLNGRNFVQLATLTPGTTQETNPNSFFNGGPSSEVSARGTFSLSVGGSRAQSTDWLLDGNDNNELTAGGISVIPSIDAIQEFKVLTYNYSAEWGTRSGPTVLVTTKSGSNQLHGSLFEFFRNTALNAKSYDFGTPRTKEKFNLNQFGGSVGGPIQKDKTFFFADYQAKRQRHGVPFTGIVPTMENQSGNFNNDPFGAPRGPGNPNGFITNLTNPYDPAGNKYQCDSATGNPLPDPGGIQAQGVGIDCSKIPADQIDATGQSMINLYPLPNASNPALGFNFTNVPVRKLNEGEFDVKVDHNFSKDDSMFARFSYDQATSFVPGGSPGFAEQGAFASTQDITNHGRNVAVSETHVFSDRTLNQVNVGFNRIFNHILSFGDRSCESAKLGILGANLDPSCPGAPPGLRQSTKDCISCGLASTQLTGYWSVGDRGFAPFQGGTNVYSAADTLDMIRGKHDIRVGFGIRVNQMNVRTNGFQDGFFLLFSAFTGDSAADLLVGQVGGAIHDQTFFGATTGRRWKVYRPFVQDDWRVSKNLTLNIGLAWALATPETEARNRQANFNFKTGQYLVAGPASLLTGCTNCVHTDGRVGIQLDKTGFEPRIGLAWSPFGDGKTSVRAGYAIFHDSAWSQGAQGLWQNPPYYAETDNFNFGGYPSFSVPCPFQNTSQTTPLDCGLQRAFLPGFTAPPVPTQFTGTIQSQNLNFKQGMVQQFNLNIERQLPAGVVLTLGYAGSRSTHILVDGLNLNVSAPAACSPSIPDPNDPTKTVPNPQFVPGYKLGCGGNDAVYPNAPYGIFTTIANINDVGKARYDSLQIKAETKSARHGLYALLGYTWSRTFDSDFPDGVGTSPGATYWPLPGTSKADWALSQINLNNSFTASVIYDLPFGKGKKFGSSWSGPVNVAFGNWQVTAIERATSGFPLFVVDSNNGNFSGSGVNFQWNGNSLNRPDQVGDPNRGGTVAANPTCPAPATVHTLQNWFNPCAFKKALSGELGNANRAPLYGPRFVNTDFSLVKNFPLSLREGMNLQFRAELFNLFNHPHFFLPGGGSGMQDINSGSSFGVVNSSLNDPRFVQFALKLNF